MSLILALTLGILYAAGFYLLLRRSMVKLIIGIILLAHAINLLLFLMGRLAPGAAPIIEEGAKQLSGSYADPLPQALILTAIVIGFGLQIFAIVLIRKLFQAVNSDDTGDLTEEEDPASAETGEAYSG
jgi:multicomponent Na+:H+ antiporter subunit C